MTPGPSFPVPFVKRCEHHLHANARSALAQDRVDHWGSMHMDRLNGAFRTLAGWEAFTASLQHPKLTASRGWAAANHDLVTVQTGPRHLLPDHHSTAALDAHLGTVRDHLDSRSFVLRNQRRTTLMLGLVRLHLNGTDNPRRYAELLRSWLTDNAGNAPAQRTGYDRGTSRRLAAHQRIVA
ncbi:hypothetical protein [Nocardioides marmotae]|uniref:hypothetical protein n=1 Tax=Nocardioides marmotae TaxID=2663857 RepID=UPI0012B568AC|nr:hypothetical protein [Nocardioides marmotae]MBC9733854.1 hypothetical protein [Nocardioides marmotae]MTB84957.1 hypothetical protein [Nocardioides marmotae]